MLSLGTSRNNGRLSMRLTPESKTYTNIPLVLLATLLTLARPSGNAVAEDLLGIYVGGAIGQSHVGATVSQVSADIFPVTYTEAIDERHAAFKVMLGVRPISLVGAEIAYIDFGEPSGSLFGHPADISMKGAVAFGVLYLPVPIVDVFLKAGVARLERTVDGSFCSPCACEICRFSFQVDRTNTSGAGGVGAQYRFGPWAVRAEYERFKAAGGNPSLWSAGVTRNFL
jgi:Outer membrane protein beta-barrel domain